MKKLNPIGLTDLRVLEFGQFMKSSISSTQALAPIADANTTAFLTALIAQSNEYDLAMMNIAKSAETIKIENADKARDQSVTVFERQLSVFEYSEVPAELDAFASIMVVMNVYKNMQNMNYEQESNAIDNFVTELSNATYAPHVFTLGMDALVARISTKNTEFKTLFEGRTLELAAKPSYDVKSMRNDLRVTYQDFANYILSMAKLPGATQAVDILNVLNTVRKYYHDLLAVRAGKNNDEEETPIPPMPEA